LGGTNIVGGFYFGNSNTLVGATALFTNAAAMYIGSQGIASNGISISTFALNNGSTLGATADWIGMVPLTLNVGTSSIKTADLDGTIHNITLSNAVVGPGGFNLIGGGTLTLDGTNTYTGGTTISNGTLVLGPSGALASSPITVGSGATFDVSQAPGFILGSGKTIAGVGTVSGAFAADGGSTISPAGIGAQGTLHFSSSLSVSNASFNMELGNDPSGVSNPNDQVAVAGDFNAAGTNTIAITPVGSLGIGTYKLITFTGNFNGGLTNLICAAGMVTNHAGEIDLVVTQVRPVENLTWKGDGSANLWDTGVSSNWFNGVGMDRFYTGDTNNFTDSTTNFVVNISGVVTPAPTAVVLVNAANDYTFQGNGDISGTTGLTKTNSGKLTILNNNDYTGVTTLGGGTLSVTNLAIGGVSSPIGAAGSAAANLVFNGGALEYLGSNVTIDRSMTLEASGGSLSITNGSTLTLSGSLTGPGILTKIGNGQLSLATSSDYSGGTTINAGTVRAAQGSGATITSLGSGTLTLNGGASSATFLFGGDGETLNNTLGIVGTNNFIANNGNDTINALTGTGTVYLNGASGNILSLHAIDMSAFGGTFSLNTLPVLRFFPSTGTSDDASGATFDLGINGGIVYNRDGGTYRLGAVTGGTTSVLRGSQNSGSAATTYIVGGNNQNAAYNGNITAGAGGVGA
ncbi:MAG TPA: autotransporter-associated beta strand repeat-containing protein, partial [Verrucomicrobiae bacterium]|nr:autotransporter-associated beta strand repeat-containing protein [Verrucomicrobiae bacterium]